MQITIDCTPEELKEIIQTQMKLDEELKDYLIKKAEVMTQNVIPQHKF